MDVSARGSLIQMHNKRGNLAPRFTLRSQARDERMPQCVIPDQPPEIRVFRRSLERPVRLITSPMLQRPPAAVARSGGHDRNALPKSRFAPEARLSSRTMVR
jgi:hypothetical protein